MALGSNPTRIVATTVLEEPSITETAFASGLVTKILLVVGLTTRSVGVSSNGILPIRVFVEPSITTRVRPS